MLSDVTRVYSFVKCMDLTDNNDNAGEVIVESLGTDRFSRIP